MSSDNFHFDLTGVPLDQALAIAFGEHPNSKLGRKAKWWGVEPARPRAKRCPSCWLEYPEDKPKRLDHPMRLVLFWSDPTGTNFGEFHALPAPMSSTDIAPIVKAWLDLEASYGHQPDHDGDNGKGWRVYNEQWGHVAGAYQAFVAIEPVWLMYGK